MVGKVENAGNQHFLLFPECFLNYQKQILPFEPHLYFRLLTLSIWTSLKIVSFGKELTHFSELVQTESICRRRNKCNLKREKSLLGWVENIVGKRENAGYLFPKCFSKPSSLGVVKSRDFVVKS